MQFLNPSLLIGLVAASIPLLLHLLNLRRLKKVEFSSIVFLKELKKSRIRNVKLRQLLLLLLRTLIIACIVLAFARPAFNSTLPGAVAHAPTSVVYIVDNTFSMDVEDERGVRLTQLKRFIRETLGDLKQGDEVSVVLLSDPFDTRMHGPTRNPEVAAEWIQGLEISYGQPKTSDAIQIANELLSDAGNINREIIVVSDGQKNVVPTSDMLSQQTSGVAVYVKSLGNASSSVPNLAIDSVYISEVLLRPGVPQDMIVGVRNWATDEFSGAVVSVFDGERRVAQQTIDIAGNTTAFVTFLVTPRQAGVSEFRVEVEGDGLVHDNVYHTSCLVPSFPKVLLVEEVSRQLSFVKAALLADGRDTNSVDEIERTSLGTFPLREYDVVILRDVNLSQQQQREITSFVESGGGLIVFVGENSIASESSSDLLGALSVSKFDRESFIDPMQFTSIDKKHPLFAGVFKNSGATIGEDPSIKQAVLFESNEILAVGRKSLLAIGGKGKGQALMFGFPADGTWTRLPFTGLFVSMVNRGIATVSASPDVTFDAIVGEPIRLQLPHGVAAGEVTEIRDGVSAKRGVSQLSTGTYIVLPASKQPGVITLQNEAGSAVAVVNANIDRSESDIQTESENALLDALRPWYEEGAVVALDGSSTEAGATRIARAGTELWTWFLGFALLCALAEMTIASRWK